MQTERVGPLQSFPSSPLLVTILQLIGRNDLTRGGDVRKVIRDDSGRIHSVEVTDFEMQLMRITTEHGVYVMRKRVEGRRFRRSVTLAVSDEDGDVVLWDWRALTMTVVRSLPDTAVLIASSWWYTIVTDPN